MLFEVSWFTTIPAIPVFVNQLSVLRKSYLMYAISIECLLSEGRTTKECYADRMAALVTRKCKQGFPFWNCMAISPRFAEKLKKTNSDDQRKGVIRQRVFCLFKQRNDIAHGRKLDNEIEPFDLLNFESLVRQSILSFVESGWNTLKEFKDWLNAVKTS